MPQVVQLDLLSNQHQLVMTAKEMQIRSAIEQTIKSAGHSPSAPRTGGRSRIMYIERKAGSLTGDARIGRVNYNKTGRTIYYRDQIFRRIVGGGFKSNYCDHATGEQYWISGPKKKGGDRLYGERLPIVIDDDVREEYWTSIRDMPERIADTDAQR